MLSMAGRICLIKSVLSSLSVYYMSSFLMPKGVCNILTSIQRRFLWSGVEKQKKICKVQWRIVVKAREEGGLGLGSLMSKNISMLFKWI
jgi:hypothetical protein